MTRLAAALLLLALVSPGLSAKDPAPAEGADHALQNVLTMKVDSLVTLDPAGALLAFQTETPMPDRLRENLDKVVSGWRFTPVLVDGAVRKVTTRMRITLVAVQDGENYRVNVDNVIFPGDPNAKAKGTLASSKETVSGMKMVKPEYPLGLLKLGVGGTVLLGIRVGADGKVIDVVAVQSSLKDVKGRPNVLAQALAQFEKSAIASARRWTFNVPASLANAPASDLTVNVPVNYYTQSPGNEKPGLWRTEVRSARRPMAWLDGEAGLQHAGVSDVNNGETIPVASAVRLQTDVIGAMVM